MHGTANGRWSGSTLGDCGVTDWEPVRHWVEAATRAPSVHNTQPWTFTFRRHELVLHADAARVLHSDPQGRELLMSCGAALHHLETAIRHDGCVPDIVRSDVGDPSAPLATVTLRTAAPATPRDIALASAADRRRSDRRPFRRAHIASMIRDIDRLCAAYCVTPAVFGEAARADLVAIADASNSSRRYDAAQHNEIHWWTGHDRPYEGVPPALLPDETTVSATGGRAFPPGLLHDDRPDEAQWIVLATRGDSPTDWLRCGEALSVVLLSATVLGLATCPVSHGIQDVAARSTLRRLMTEHGIVPHLHPQILVRVGAAPHPSLPAWTPRRPVDEVLVVDDAP
ncbi:Acg family FMN-binding oxidoreductase [Williamsia sp. SKLECPSW1]